MSRSLAGTLAPLPLTFALAFAFFIHISGSRVLLTLYALDVGAVPFEIGALSATFYVFPFLLSWPIGMLADRFGSRGLLALAAAVGAASMLVPVFMRSMGALYAAGLLLGLAFAFHNVLIHNLVGTLSAPHERNRHLSNLTLLGAITMSLGPLMTGVSIDLSGYAATCVYAGAVSLLALAMVAAWGATLPGGTGLAHARMPLRDTLLNRGIWRVLVTSSLVQLGIDIYQLYLPVYAHRLGLSASAIGLVISVYAVAIFIARLMLPRILKHASEERLLAGAFAVGAASFALIPLFESALMLGVLSFAFGLGVGCGQPLSLILTFKHSAEARSGETLGLRLSVNSLTHIIGPLLFGAIGSVLGLFAVFAANAGMLGAGGLLSRSGDSKRKRDTA